MRSAKALSSGNNAESRAETFSVRCRDHAQFGLGDLLKMRVQKGWHRIMGVAQSVFLWSCLSRFPLLARSCSLR